MSDDVDDVAMRLRRHFRRQLEKPIKPGRIDSSRYLIGLAIDRLNGQAETIEELQALLRTCLPQTSFER
jgi:hypothetical protein